MSLFSMFRKRLKRSGTKADNLVLYDGKGYAYELRQWKANMAVYYIGSIYPVSGLVVSDRKPKEASKSAPTEPAPYTDIYK